MAEGNQVARTQDEKLDYVMRLQERLLVKLFGDVEGENPNGRVPLMEEKLGDHEKRLRALERVALRVGGALGLIAVLAGALEAAAHLVSTMKH